MDLRLEILKVAFQMLPWNQQDPKSNVYSELWRNIGNEQFKTRNFEAALEFYNASLCYAPAGSENIPLAYGNRSAVYCMMAKYALAIENIKLARESGFPAGKMAQLDAREEKCKKLMEEFGPDKNFDASSFFKLSHPPNAKIPFIADCLELRKSEKYGRHIVTTKDLKTGDIIAIETPVFVWPSSPLFRISCSFCTKANDGSLLPCGHCTTVMYCSNECRNMAATVHLNNEFRAFDSGEQKIVLKMMLETFRIAGGVDEALKLLKDSEGKTIFDFDFSNPKDPNYEKNKLIALNGLCKNVQTRNIIDFKPKELLSTSPINEKARTSKEREQLLRFIISQYRIWFSNAILFETNHRAILLFKSLLNHSCTPNVYRFPFGEKSVYIVLRPIEAGKQIFISYGIHATEKTKENRRKRLPFKCDCEACINDWPTEFPRKDSRFVEPKYEKIPPEEAIEQFKKNCKYIDDNAGKHPCYEIERLVDHNIFLALCISGDPALEDALKRSSE